MRHYLSVLWMTGVLALTPAPSPSRAPAVDFRPVDSLWVRALAEGDLVSPAYWRQSRGQSGDLSFAFLPFRPTMAVRVGQFTITSHAPAGLVDGHPAYLLTGHFHFALNNMPNVKYDAWTTILGVNYGPRGWRLDNVLATRTSAWRTERIGALAVRVPKDSALPPEWRAAAAFADSLARAYRVHVPASGILVYAAPSVPWIVGVDSQPLHVSRMAYYDPRTGSIVAPLHSPPDAPGVVRHEIVHAVLERALNHRRVSWAMTEGVAVYYAGAYGCPTSEAFIREMADSSDDASSSLDLDMALAHITGSDNTGAGEHVGLLGAILATAMADSEGGPKEIRALILADSVTRPGNEMEAVYAAMHMADVLHVKGRLDRALFDFGRARARANATSPDASVRQRANARCQNERKGAAGY